MRAYIKKGITRKQFHDMGIITPKTKELLDGSHDSYHGEFDTYGNGRKVFVFKDSRLPSTCWINAEFVVAESHENINSFGETDEK